MTSLCRPVFSMIAGALFICLSLSACGDVSPMEFNLADKRTWVDLVADAQKAQGRGNLPEAEKLFQEALQKAEAKYGEDAIETGTCVGYLAELYRYQQEYLKADKEYKRWLTIMQKHDSTGEQVKNIRKNYKEVRKKIRQYGLMDDKDTDKKDGDSGDAKNKDDSKEGAEDGAED